MAIAIHVDCACDTINSTSTTSPSHAETIMSDRDAITEGLYVPGYLSNPGGCGASSAEIAALLVFRADSTIQVVEASSCERYGADGVPPAEALVHFAGTDPEEGAMSI